MAAAKPMTFASVTALLLATALTACSRPAPESPPPRPVRVMEIGADSTSGSLQLAGEVRARYEARVGFRVGGKILRRLVDVGDRVKAGTPLAELDTTDYRLTAESIAAQLKGARADLAFAEEDEQRYRELRDQQLVSDADFDRHATTTKTLRERATNLAAQVEQARNQVGYARLLADHEAVVVAVLAEADQVVAPGQPVLLLARPEELEVAIDVPEDRRQFIAAAEAIGITVWARPGVRLNGRLRELSASASPASRTYAARVSLSTRPEWVHLGMSATASVRDKGSAGHRIPLSAVFQRHAEANGMARVWVVNAEGTAVSSVPVEIGSPSGENEVVAQGLSPGQRIVTAGATRLREGESIKILGPSELGASPVERDPAAPGAARSSRAAPPAAGDSAGAKAERR